jgi:hypothetical protein
MMRLKNLSVRGKVLLIVGVGLFFLLVIAATGLFYLNASNRSLATTVEVEAEAIRQAARVRADFLDMIIAEKNMIMSKDEADESRHRAAFDANRRELDGELDTLREVTGGFGAKHIDESAGDIHQESGLDTVTIERPEACSPMITRRCDRREGKSWAT